MHGFDIDVESTGLSPAWDTFVAVTPGGHHAQTSLWAQVKGALGWDATRLIVRQDSQIVGGIQLLTKQLPGGLGHVGFAPRGPLFGMRDGHLLREVHDALLSHARAQRILYLKAQPPIDRHDLVPALEGLGWAQSSLEAAPTASLRIDLTPPEDQLLANMRKTTRNLVRQGPRRGLRIRAGDGGDLAVFYQLVDATSRRQRFAPYPAIYYDTMFRVFSAVNGARLLLAELDGRVVSAALLVAFGDTVTYKMGGWSGDHPSVAPNEPVQWEAICWSKANGFRWYDFDGISRAAAVALSRSGSAPDHLRGGVLHFKLGFGGEIALFPGALDNTPSSALRPLVHLLARHADRALPLAHRAAGRRVTQLQSTSS